MKNKNAKLKHSGGPKFIPDLSGASHIFLASSDEKKNESLGEIREGMVCNKNKIATRLDSRCMGSFLILRQNIETPGKFNFPVVRRQCGEKKKKYVD